MNIYDFTVKKQDGTEVSLDEYRGKVLLIVNTATGCGFTPQYDELEEIYESFRDRGFEILDFPCNQFGEQAPGDDEEIHSFCTANYGITFPQFSKVDVNGETAIPLYAWLQEQENGKFLGFDKLNPASAMMNMVVKKFDPDFKNNNRIKWNFTKFLIDREGAVAARFEPMTALKKVKAKIEEVL